MQDINIIGMTVKQTGDALVCFHFAIAGGGCMDYLFTALGLFVLGVLTMLLPKRLELGAHYAAMVLAAGASVLVLLFSLGPLLTGAVVNPLVFGRYSLMVDTWSAAFLLITGLSGAAVSIYGIGYGKGYLGHRIRLLSGLWNLFILSMVLVIVAGDAFTFILSWEVMALVSFLLVNHESEKKEVVNAAYQYMVMTHLGTAAILVAFYLLGSASESFSFTAMAENTLETPMRHIVFAAAFIGFALKSGLMPLHVWLPNAHPAAPSHVSALMSGVMLKVAVYGFGRFMFWFLDCTNFYYGFIVMSVGLISAFLGVLYASMEKDMKKILAYSSVENMGIIYTAFGCGMLLVSMGKGSVALVAFTAVLVHALSHSMMKCLLFMSAGSVLHATGTKNIELLGALASRMPWTAALTLVGAMSLASLPFTSGLIGEWMTLQSVMTLAWQADAQELRVFVLIAFILMGLTGALALGCFVRLYGVTFLGRRRSSLVQKAHEMPWTMLLGMGIEAILIILLGIFPMPMVSVMQGALTGGVVVLPMTGLLGVFWAGNGSFSLYSPLILVVLAVIICGILGMTLVGKKRFVEQEETWNCGTVPTRREQYSATGFSKPLRRAFDFILQPKRERVYLKKDHSYFGRQQEYHLNIPDQFSERLYKPIEHLVVRAADAMLALQQGSVRLYIGYTMIAMIAVLIWGVM